MQAPPSRASWQDAFVNRFDTRKNSMKMNEKMIAVMREATQRLQNGGANSATDTIQRTLQKMLPAGVLDAARDRSKVVPPAGPMRDINPAPPSRAGSVDAMADFVPELLAGLRMRSPLDLDASAFGMPDFAPKSGADIGAEQSGGGQFVAKSYTNHAGTRGYKVYIPTGYHGQPLPLVVMLHGCTQSPDDFAAGTRMNAIAEEKQCLVVYPAQSQSANGSKCWNWFNAIDQKRDQGEPSIIAGITREVINTYHVDARQVYVAGLSAGGAMAVILGTMYPDLYAAVGIHSGLPYAAAADLPSALAAMKGGMAAERGRTSAASGPAARLQAIPVIVFHGDHDKTVHSRNGDQIAAQSARDLGQAASNGGATTRLKTTVQKGQAPNGRSYTRTSHQGESGPAVVEQWLVHGAGHAWFGGSSRGSYTDAKGPDASQEMMRFFSTHIQPAASR